MASLFSLKNIPRLILLLALLLAIPMMMEMNRVLSVEAQRAREKYENQVQSLRKVTQSLEAAEHRLHRMTSSVSAVEMEVRSSLRLVKPGERLVLVEHEHPL
jgi:cell division protein FtsB